MLADEITPAIDGIPAEKAAPLPARARGAESCPVLRVHERTGAYVREAVKAAEENTALIKRGSVQEVEEGGAGGAPLREQDKVLVAVRSRAGLKANTIVGEATNQARASAELQEVRGLATRRAELATRANRKHLGVEHAHDCCRRAHR